MGFLSVIVAGAVAFVFGAVWYGFLGKAWIAASGVPCDAAGNPENRKDPVPYVTSLLSAVLVAGMMRHVLGTRGIETAGKGLVAGLGIGVFIVCPWIATFYSFSARPRRLLWIDGAYASIGCALIGATLCLF